MKRIAIVTAVVALLLLIDGTYLQLSHNEVGGDSGILFGNPNLFLSAGTVVLISGGLILLGAAFMWVVAVRRAGRLPAEGARASQPQASEAPSKVAAAQAGSGQAGSGQAAAEAQTGKGQGYRQQP
jgi:hypothetical protein